jgi:hypothetical protein
MSASDQYQYTYMTSLIINPLANMMKALSSRQYGQALDWEEVFIISLHKKTSKDKLRPMVDTIRAFRARVMGSGTVDPFQNWASLEAEKREIFELEGPQLALDLYEKINQVLSEDRLFEHIQGLMIGQIEFSKEDTLQGDGSGGDVEP